MIAGFQANVCGGPIGPIPGPGQAVDLCVGSPVFFMPTLPKDHAIPDQDAPDQRIGMDPPPPLPAQLHSSSQVKPIL